MKSLMSVYSVHLVNGVLGLGAVPVALRLLGAEGYGLFSLYTLMVSYLLFADLGIAKNLQAVLARHRSAADEITHRRSALGTALGLYSLLCAAWLATLPLLLWLIPRFVFPVDAEYQGTLRLLIVLALGEFILNVPHSLIQSACLAREDFARYSRYALFSGLLRNSVLIVGVVVFRSPGALAAAMLARKALDVCIAWWVMGAMPRDSWRPHYKRSAAVAMLAQSGMLSVSQILNSTLMGAGSYLVNAFLGLNALGLYRVAFDLAGKVAVIANGITLILFPKAAFAFADSAHRRILGVLLRPALEASWSFYMLLGACGVAVAPLILPWVGIIQPDAVALFISLAVGLSLNCHTSIASELIQATGRYRQNIVVSLAGISVTVGVFLATMTIAGLSAIGVAWIATSVVSALLADAILLSTVEAPASGQLALVFGKTAIFMLGLIGLAAAFGYTEQRWAPALAACALLVVTVWKIAALSRSVAASGWHDLEAAARDQELAAA
jgi:O-antigen/teichoic acid export membrane protein